MKKIFAILMLAATVAACTVEDMKEQPVEPQTYTMTVKATKGVDTKALYFGNDGKLNAKWVNGDYVEVYRSGETDPIGKLYASGLPDEGSISCNLSGTLSTVTDGETLTLKFNSATYDNQDGTLNYIASHCDYAKATTQVEVIGNTVIGSDASFTNQNAIVKFTLKYGNTVLRPSKLVVTGSVSANMMSLWNYYAPGKQFPTIPTFDLSISSEAQEAGFVYFATPGLTNEQFSTLNSILYFNSSAVTVGLTATVGGETYTYTKSGYPFEAGNYYDIIVNMTKQE